MKNTLLLAGAGLMCGLAVNAAAPAPELPCRWERLNLDGGESWKERTILGFPGEGEPGKGWGNRLNFAPDGTLYAATFHQGLWKSSDAGDNWEFVGLGDKFLTNVLTDPDDANRLWPPTAAAVFTRAATAERAGTACWNRV